MLQSLLQGLGIGIGFTISIIIGFVLFIGIKAMFKKYKPKDLLEPFEDYKSKLLDEEKYEEVLAVSNILTYLKLGKLHDDIDDYEIEKTETKLTDFISLVDDEDEYENVLLDKKDNNHKKTKYVVKGKKEGL